VSFIQKKENIHKITEKIYEPYERCCIFDGPEFLSRKGEFAIFFSSSFCV